MKTYAGFDYVSGSHSNSVNTYDFNMLRVRGGMRFFDVVSAEVQYGTSIGGSGAGEAEVDNYVGLLLVPTATLFNTLELSFPVGLSKLDVKQGSRSSSDTDISYGVQTDLPLRLFADLPDLRLGGGFMIYHAGNSTRTYGFNLGIRYDFDAGDFELINPVKWFDDLFGGGGSGGETAPEDSADKSSDTQ